MVLGGYRCWLQIFTHSSMWSDGPHAVGARVGPAPGLDAIAVTAHNELVDAHVSAFSERIGGPTILTGQEILAPGHHVIAVGVEPSSVASARRRPDRCGPSPGRRHDRRTPVKASGLASTRPR
jgi:hypothetical protein